MSDNVIDIERLRNRAGKIRERPQLGDPIDKYKGKWRNILFDKAGHAFRAPNLWDTEAMAAEALRNCIQRMQIDLRDGIIPFFYCLDGNLPYFDYAYALQMPAGE